MVLSPPPEGVPVGTLCFWMGNTIPDGWMMANGATLQSSDYPELFDKLGYKYGGSGSTFALPNLTGSKYFLRCSSTAGITQQDTFKSHTHHSEVSNGIYAQRWDGAVAYGWNNGGRMNITVQATGDEETRPINMSSIPIIKYE